MKLYSFHKKVQPLLDFLNIRNLEWKISTPVRGCHVLYVHDSIGETSYLKSFLDLIELHSLSYCYYPKYSAYSIF